MINTISCVDDLSHQEEIISNKLFSLPSFLRPLLIGPKVYFDIRGLFKETNELFDSCEYHSLILAITPKERKEFSDEIIMLISKTEKIKNRLISQIRTYYQPLLKPAIKKLIETNSFLHDKIIEFNLVTSKKFIIALEKVVETSSDESFDIDRVVRVESIL